MNAASHPRHRHTWRDYRRILWRRSSVNGRRGYPREGIEKRCECGAVAWCEPGKWLINYPKRRASAARG